jgi:16S rRNA (guanine527-N7)-methyltransferase
MEQLAAGARRLGLALTEAQLALFQTYYEELVAWNRRVNLTTIIGYQEVQTVHFLDSLTCLLAFPGWKDAQQVRAIDIGAGGGFPGLPLKIVWPALQLSLLEATGKKAAFLEHLIGRLSLKDVTVIHGRAEELAHEEGQREAYDLVLARAVAEMATLAELTLPFCLVGGRVVAPKGEDVGEEVEAAGRAITLLGGRLRQVMPVVLSPFLGPRTLVVLEKVAPAPAKYPRRPGLPAKRPLL